MRNDTLNLAKCDPASKHVLLRQDRLKVPSALLPRRAMSSPPSITAGTSTTIGATYQSFKV